MQTPARTLRADVEDTDRAPQPLTAQERRSRERILAMGQTLMARRGRHTITLSAFALALNITTRALRRHFVDLDALRAAILLAHLKTIAHAIGAIPPDAPDCAAQRRRAYLNATRTPLGGFNEPHLLLVRDRNQLPEDELAAIEAYRASLGLLLAGPHGPTVLDLLDTPTLDRALIEPILKLLQSPPESKKPEPVRTPPAPRPQNTNAPQDLLAKWRQNAAADALPPKIVSLIDDLAAISGVRNPGGLTRKQGPPAR